MPTVKKLYLVSDPQELHLSLQEMFYPTEVPCALKYVFTFSILLMDVCVDVWVKFDIRDCFHIHLLEERKVSLCSPLNLSLLNGIKHGRRLRCHTKISL